jgi:uroporphyrinogen decarboxylase
MWRKYFKPTLAKLGERLRAANITYFLHCCGHLEPIIPDLIEIGVEILHPLQPEAMDIAMLKREYGQHLTFMGGISTQRLLPFGSPEEVARVTKETMASMGKGGGYICAPSKPIMRDVPFENGLALVETLIRQ